MNPEDAADYALGNVDEPPEPPADAGSSSSSSAGEAAGGSGGEERADSIGEILLHTEPDLKPEQVKDDLEVGDSAAHAYIMVRKMLAAVFPSLRSQTGTPAIVNGGWALYYAIEDRQEAVESGDENGGERGEGEEGPVTGNPEPQLVPASGGEPADA